MNYELGIREIFPERSRGAPMREIFPERSRRATLRVFLFSFLIFFVAVNVAFAQSAGDMFTVNLKIGSRDATTAGQVSKLQQLLQSEGADVYPEGLITGYYGPITARAVTRFQEKYASEILTPAGLVAGTGFVGTATRAKLNTLAAGGISAVSPAQSGALVSNAGSAILSRLPPQLTFSAEPYFEDDGVLGHTKRILLSWASPNVTSCTASGDWLGNKAASGSEFLEIAKSSSYILTCSNKAGTLSKIIKVQVTGGGAAQGPGLEFSAVSDASGVTFSWKASNSDSCAASGDWQGSRGVSGNEKVSPTKDSVYALTCFNPSGNVTRAVKVGAEKAVSANPPALDFTAVTNTDGTVGLTWSASGGAACKADGGWSGDKNSIGSQTVPASNTGYTLTCSNASGSAAKTLLITVQAITQASPALTFGGDKTSIARGEPVTLAWSSTNTSQCSAAGAWSGSKSTAGAETVIPVGNGETLDEATYTLICSGASGSATKSLRFTVTKSVTSIPPAVGGEIPASPQLPALSFSADTASWDREGTVTLSWRAEGASSCTASDGWSAPKLVSGTETVTPSKDTTYTLGCSNAAGVVRKFVTVQVKDRPRLTLQATPSSIAKGESVALSWSSTAATSCVAEGGWGGVKALEGTEKATPERSSTYTLVCSNDAGSIAGSVSVDVKEPIVPQPTLIFQIYPTLIARGEDIALAWSATDVESCSAFGAWSGEQPADGSAVLSPKADATYTLVCSNSSGSVTKSVSVEVLPPKPTLTLQASATSIIRGESATLKWISSDADSCVAKDGWSGARALSGSEKVSPTRSTTYTLSCSSISGSVTQQVAIEVKDKTPPPVLVFDADADLVGAGDEVLLSWDAKYADSCTASGAWSGSKSSAGREAVVPAESSTYTLTCTNSRGSANASVSVNVQKKPSVTFAPDLPAITKGGFVTLSWSSKDAASCVAKDGWGGIKPLSGSEKVSPTESTVYTIVCSNIAGSAVESVAVDVKTPLVRPPTLTFQKNGLVILGNGGRPINSVTLSWSATGVESCTASGGWSGRKTGSGSESVTPSDDTSYALVCTNTAGSVRKEVTVNVVGTGALREDDFEIFIDLDDEPTISQKSVVVSAPTLTFDASSLSVTRGQSALLSWFSASASSCVASNGTEGWAGARGTTGVYTVAPLQTTTYTLTCSNSAGPVVKSVTISVAEPIASSPTRDYAVRPVIFLPKDTSIDTAKYREQVDKSFAEVSLWYRSMLGKTFRVLPALVYTSSLTKTQLQAKYPGQSTQMWFDGLKEALRANGLDPCDDHRFYYFSHTMDNTLGAMVGLENLGCKIVLPGTANIGGHMGRLVGGVIDPNWFESFADEIREAQGGVAHEIGHGLGGMCANGNYYNSRADNGKCDFLPHSPATVNSVMFQWWNFGAGASLMEREKEILRRSPFMVE